MVAPALRAGAVILLASSLFLREDRKQLERMRPYSPLATLLARCAPRAWHDVAFFDATLASGVEEFTAKLRESARASSASSRTLQLPHQDVYGEDA
jgi:hypothetical protein